MGTADAGEPSMALGGVKTGRLVVISGPSGSGKSTVCKRVLDLPGISAALSVSMTTRAPRPGEQEGVEYYFRSRNEFALARDRGELLEWAHVHGNQYGTPAAPVAAALESGKCVLLEIDVQGAFQVKKNRPDAVLVFLHPPGFQALEERLKVRGSDDLQTIERRLANARHEIEQAKGYDHELVNEDLDSCVRSLADILIHIGCGA